ncbi:sensor histidine kinase [Enterococcus sp. LJL99]
MSKKLKEYELFTKLIVIIFIGLCAQAIIISLFIYHRSKNVYIELFDKSNTVVLKKIQKDFETLNDSIENTLAMIEANPSVHEYFSADGDFSSIDQFNQLSSVQKMNTSLGETFPTIDYDLIVYGENGRTWIDSEMLVSINATTFFQSDIIKTVSESPFVTQMIYTDYGLTLRDKNSESILFIKKLKNSLNRVYGYAVVSISADQLANLFKSMVNPEISEIYVVNDQQKIITSNVTKRIGTQSTFLDQIDLNETKTTRTDQLTRLALYRQNLSLVSQVNIQSLTNQMGVLLPIILYSIASILLVGFFVFIYLNRNTKSIYRLINSLKNINKNSLKIDVPDQGIYEVQILGNTINQLLGDLHAYYINSVKNEQKKRTLEIQTMQAQIQPHFIYNTLTSIKFMIWQQENEKAVEGLESFIDLLRSTLSKKEEVILVEEELHSIQSYITILALRYGDNISTKIMMPEELLSLYIPNMIIQPIVENAYLHAFHSTEQGFITIYGKLKQESLIFEIVDSGDGFDPSLSQEKKVDYFSGIGMSNVNERIQLMYGENYGLTVHSVIGVGTTVKIRLPIIRTLPVKTDIQ